jgi:hypothetical protein
MDKVKTQANKLWQILSSTTTYGTYANTLALTGRILVEVGLLLWLVVCLTLVAGEWFWAFSVGSGRDFRTWFDNLQGSSDQIATETGKALLNASKNSLDSTIAAAKKQLGIQDDA